MNIVEQLHQEADHIADQQIGRVINDAFRNSDFLCLHCKYPENIEKYEHILKHYSIAKVNLHRIRKRIENSRIGYSHIETVRERSSSRDNIQSEEVYWASVVDGYKSELKHISPCIECKNRYNPTSQSKRVTKNTPKRKGFLDYE